MVIPKTLSIAVLGLDINLDSFLIHCSAMFLKKSYYILCENFELVDFWYKFISGLFGNIPVNKIRHYMLAMLLGLFSDNYSKNWLIKAHTMCWIIH